jgi:TPR repeat protein
MHALGCARKQQGALEQALEWWENAAYAGSFDAMADLGRHFYRAGRYEDAEWLLMLAYSAGNFRAGYSGAVIKASRGEVRESLRIGLDSKFNSGEMFTAPLTRLLFILTRSKLRRKRHINL